MSQTIICPICGSENPEGSEFCQVCKANLRTLPSEIFQHSTDPAAAGKPAELNAKTPRNDEPDLDSPVPVWLKDKLKPTSAEKKPMDFDAYSNLLFGVPDSSKSSSQNKFGRTFKKPEPVYQPMFQGMIEPPLLEPDENSPKTLEENLPGIADFSIQRPARKWEDKKPETVDPSYKGTSISLLEDFNTERPARKWDDRQPDISAAHSSEDIIQLPLWWQQDAPLVEDDENTDSAKFVEDDDPALENSVSPTKVADAVNFFSADAAVIADNDHEEKPSAPAPRNDEYKPESGSLISDLLNDINSNSGSLTPAEQEENRNGTLFYSGNHPENDDIPEPDYSEITLPENNEGPNAEVLDRILRNIGYEVEGTPQPEKAAAGPSDDQSKSSEEPGEKAETAEPAEQAAEVLKPIHGFYIPEVIDNPLIPNDNDDGLESKDGDPDDTDGMDPQDRDEFDDDQDIPWDLFGSADMALPQSPEDPAFRTFSRSSIPDDPGSTTYQQRMISSILGKIIQAENYVEPPKVKNNRAVSLPARLLWAALALCGIFVLLLTDIADNFYLPLIPAADESQTFFENAENNAGSALVVMDYTPAYSSEMRTAAETLIRTLSGRAEQVYMAVLNPAAMPESMQILQQFDSSVEFSGWWPSGIISIRSALASGNVPENVWLLTSEITSVRNWAEQLSVSGGERKLHVMGPGQLEPVLKPYLQSGLITSFLSRDYDVSNYGEYDHPVGRTQMAVWYLCALVPLAWLGGVVSRIMKSEPHYSKRSAVPADKSQQLSESESEKETVND